MISGIHFKSFLVFISGIHFITWYDRVRYDTIVHMPADMDRNRKRTEHSISRIHFLFLFSAEMQLATPVHLRFCEILGRILGKF